MIEVTKTWLKRDILNSEILPKNDFNIHQRDRIDKSGGGALLTVRSSIPSLSVEMGPNSCFLLTT